MAKKERYPFIVAVHALFFKGGKVLLLRRANTGYMDGYLSVPAGHVDGGETIWLAMQREIAEELDLSLTKDFLPAHVMHRMKKTEERIDYFFAIREWDGEIQNAEPQKCAELVWSEVSQLPKAEIVPYVLAAIEHVQAGRQFSEFVERE